MSIEKPIMWLANPRVQNRESVEAIAAVLPPEAPRQARNFHRQIPGYHISPLKSLPHLAERLGLGGIWVKDESARLNLGSFKVLGGSFAIYQLLKRRLGMEQQALTFEELTSGPLRNKLGDVTFAAATDGNHGRGVAWSAAQMGFHSVIYVHKLTSKARIQAIQRNGAQVVVVDGTYDDAVRQVWEEAQEHGWEVISDTAWEGYTSVPKWVMQGYTTMLSEAQEQFAGQGLIGPTHILIQAGVGSLAAATLGFYQNIFGKDRPRSVVIEPSKAACLYQSASIGDGKPHSYEGDLDTIMAGLACGDPNPLAWDILSEVADFFATCPDYVAAKGMRVYGIPLAGDPFIVSGESGAVTLGALTFIMEFQGAAHLKEELRLDRDSQVLLINSEGNTDPDEFRHIAWEGSIPVPSQYQQFHRH